jgi:hypothetical protein
MEALAFAEPAVPVHEIEYAVLLVGEIVTDPDIPVGVKFVPVQELALVEFQLRVDDCPEVSDVGLAVNEAVVVDEVAIGPAA